MSRATAFAASASHFTTSSQRDSGASPSRPPAFGVELKVSMTPIRVGGTPISVEVAIRVRRVERSRSDPLLTPCFHTDGPLKYTSGTRSA